ncbi:MAG TPA: helix-turn-helix domain-containing protein [Chloroflexota bacterium]|nr:helix-turn-helix domain-containing protein [Chloroflexota bacterium]HUM68472.1 helix-turn-helix domain-containing protein [Chloroflexota bacterium]
MDEQQNEQLVLAAEERAVCERVTAGKAPHSQRAQAVLALADGATLAEAAAKTGLTENQVKHWQGRFRNGRLTIFPEEALARGDTAVASPPPIAIESLPPIAPAKEEKKEKKAGKDGGKKKKEKKDKDTDKGKEKGKKKGKKKKKKEKERKEKSKKSKKK